MQRPNAVQIGKSEEELERCQASHLLPCPCVKGQVACLSLPSCSMP